LKQFKEGGIEKLKEINFYQPKSELKEHIHTIEKYLRQNPPATIAEASCMIEKLTGVKRGPTQTGIFIKSLGVRLRKVGTIPAKALDETKKKNKRNF
jgi:transposase